MNNVLLAQEVKGLKVYRLSTQQPLITKCYPVILPANIKDMIEHELSEGNTVVCKNFILYSINSAGSKKVLCPEEYKRVNRYRLYKGGELITDIDSSLFIDGSEEEFNFIRLVAYFMRNNEVTIELN